MDSAGTSAEHEGDCPDSRSIAVAKRHAIDISAGRSNSRQPTVLHRRGHPEPKEGVGDAVARRAQSSEIGGRVCGACEASAVEGAAIERRHSVMV